VLQHDNDDVGDLPLSGRVLGDLSLNDIVEIRIRVSERLPDGELPTTLALLNSSGDIFELVLFGDKELEIYTADVLDRRSVPWIKYIPAQQE
jgi:hypothetical protein